MIGLLVVAGLCFAAAFGAALVRPGFVAQVYRPASEPARPVEGSTRRIVTVLLALGVVALGLGVLRLFAAFATDDLRYAYVATHTRSGTSFGLRLAGVWAGAEGSLLFFAFIVTAVPTLAWFATSGPQSRAGLIGVFGAGMTGAVVAAAYPFDRLAAAPVGGQGVTPILEHPAMIVHPPLLYLGLGLALAPFVAGRGQQRWAAAAASVLVVALGIGAWWAYVEVGWGGWWAWDPVENTALIVWLLTVAGLHYRPAASWCFALAWPAVGLGTALTRTSLRTSVHAFADASGLGWWLWTTAGVATVSIAASLYRRYRIEPSGGNRHGAGVDRDGKARLGASVALLTMTAIVALGTYRPFVDGDATAGWFFSRTLYVPIVAGIVALGVIPARRWNQALVVRVVVGVGVGAAVGGWLNSTSALHGFQWLLAVACGIGLVAVVSDRRWRKRRSWSQLGAHLGVVVIAFGALGSTAHHERIVPLEVGESTTVAGHEVQVTEISAVERTGQPGEIPRVQVDTIIDGSPVSTSFDVYPEKGINLIEVGSRSTPTTDVQVVFVSVDTADADRPRAVLRIDVRPLNQLVWWGIGLMASGTLLGAVGATRCHPHPASAPPNELVD